MAKCMICGSQASDLRYHITLKHNISAAEYKAEYGGVVVDPSVEAKRRRTCQDRYGDPVYKNREAIKMSQEIYEGGHPLKDPEVRKKAGDTMEIKYGERHFTNRAKARETCLKRYGVEYTTQIPEIIEKRVDTLKKKYGKVFNIDSPHNKKEAPEDFKDVYMSGITMEQLSKRYGVTEPTVLRWVKEAGLKRKAAGQTDRNIQSPREVAEAYINVCRDHSKTLSFYEYGKIAGTSACTKMKRLFNKGKKSEHLKSRLFKAVGDQDAYQTLMEELSGS